MTADELKSMPKGQFIVMKTGAHPMKVKLKLFFQWGISFGAPYVGPDKGNRPVAYAGKETLVQAIQEKYPPQEAPQQPKVKEQPPQPGQGDKRLHANSPGRRKTKPGKEREDDRP